MSQRLQVMMNRKPCYDIVFAPNFESLQEELALLETAEKKLCIVTDSKVDSIYGEAVLSLIQGSCAKAVKFVFENGEENKNLDTVKGIYKFLIEEGYLAGRAIVVGAEFGKRHSSLHSHALRLSSDSQNMSAF